MGALRLAGARVGRRGAALLFFALVDWAFVLILALPDAQTRSADTYRWAAAIAPLWVWSLAWLCAALVTSVNAFRRCDRFGFAAAMGANIMWALVNFSGWLVGHNPRGWIGALVFAAFAGFVGVIAGWPEVAGTKEPLWTRRRL